MIESIWRFPLKSAQGESLGQAAIGADGPTGDRAWACVTADGMVVSAKHPRRWGRLLFVTAALSATGQVTIRVPGGPPLPAGTPAADEALSAWLGQPVRLASVVPEGARLHRLWPAEPGMIPEWAASAARGQAGAEEITAISGARPGGRFTDFAAIHLVTTHALAGLRQAGVPADVRRMRPNLVLSLDREPEPGDTIAAGPDVTLRVLVPTPRCAIPAAAQPGLPDAPELLRELGRHHHMQIPGLGRAACFGVYARVITPGTVTVGDHAAITAA